MMDSVESGAGEVGTASEFDEGRGAAALPPHARETRHKARAGKSNVRLRREKNLWVMVSEIFLGVKQGWVFFPVRVETAHNHKNINMDSNVVVSIRP